MKNRIMIILAVACAAVACVDPNPQIEFGVDTDNINIGAAGGVRKINISSSGNWVAMTESPWIAVSPANGRGSVECVISIDSTLVVEQRTGSVRIQNLDTEEKRDFTIVQDGFEYQIVLDEPQVDVSDYAAYESRYFEVNVRSNVDFDVVLPEGADKWLSYKKSDLTLDRGARPRVSKVRFDWKVNSRDIERIADVVFEPAKNVQMSRHDALKVVQKAALPIPVGTPAGDSLALLAVSRKRLQSQ